MARNVEDNIKGLVKSIAGFVQAKNIADTGGDMQGDAYALGQLQEMQRKRLKDEHEKHVSDYQKQVAFDDAAKLAKEQGHELEKQKQKFGLESEAEVKKQVLQSFIKSTIQSAQEGSINSASFKGESIEDLKEHAQNILRAGAKLGIPPQHIISIVRLNQKSKDHVSMEKTTELYRTYIRGKESGEIPEEMTYLEFTQLHNKEQLGETVKQYKFYEKNYEERKKQWEERETRPFLEKKKSFYEWNFATTSKTALAKERKNAETFVQKVLNSEHHPDIYINPETGVPLEDALKLFRLNYPNIVKSPNANRVFTAMIKNAAQNYHKKERVATSENMKILGKVGVKRVHSIYGALLFNKELQKSHLSQVVGFDPADGTMDAKYHTGTKNDDKKISQLSSSEARNLLNLYQLTVLQETLEREKKKGKYEDVVDTKDLFDSTEFLNAVKAYVEERDPHADYLHRLQKVLHSPDKAIDANALSQTLYNANISEKQVYVGFKTEYPVLTKLLEMFDRPIESSSSFNESANTSVNTRVSKNDSGKVTTKYFNNYAGLSSFAKSNIDVTFGQKDMVSAINKIREMPVRSPDRDNLILSTSLNAYPSSNAQDPNKPGSAYMTAVAMKITGSQTQSVTQNKKNSIFATFRVTSTLEHARKGSKSKDWKNREKKQANWRRLLGTTTRMLRYQNTLTGDGDIDEDPPNSKIINFTHAKRTGGFGLAGAYERLIGTIQQLGKEALNANILGNISNTARQAMRHLETSKGQFNGWTQEGVTTESLEKVIKLEGVFSERYAQLEKARMENTISQRNFAIRTALLFDKIQFTYKLAGVIQGDQTGGRTISNQDFQTVYDNLWGYTDASATINLSNIKHWVTQQVAAFDAEDLHYEVFGPMSAEMIATFQKIREHQDNAFLSANLESMGQRQTRENNPIPPAQRSFFDLQTSAVGSPKSNGVPFPRFIAPDRDVAFSIWKKNTDEDVQKSFSSLNISAQKLSTVITDVNNGEYEWTNAHTDMFDKYMQFHYDFYTLWNWKSKNTANYSQVEKSIDKHRNDLSEFIELIKKGGHK
jgi:hypothetical protein